MFFFDTHSYSIGHIIERTPDTVENERVQLLRSIDIEFLILSFLSFLTYLVLFTALSFLFFKRINFEFLFRTLIDRGSNPMSKHVFIRLSVCGFIIFSFVFAQISTNNIKVRFLRLILENSNIFIFFNRQKR